MVSKPGVIEKSSRHKKQPLGHAVKRDLQRVDRTEIKRRQKVLSPGNRAIDSVCSGAEALLGFSKFKIPIIL